MLVDPEPVIGVFANDGLKLVPAGLSNLLVGTAWRESEPRQNTDHVAAIPPWQSYPWDNRKSGSLMQESVDLGHAHFQTEPVDDDSGISKLQCQIGEEEDRLTGPERS